MQIITRQYHLPWAEISADLVLVGPFQHFITLQFAENMEQFRIKHDTQSLLPYPSAIRWAALPELRAAGDFIELEQLATGRTETDSESPDLGSPSSSAYHEPNLSDASESGSEESFVSCSDDSTSYAEKR